MTAVLFPQEFTCEICGGQSYWGRRAFERHFKEWRHQNGMRALGIPNTKTFFEVTQMKDALELWTSIKVNFTSPLPPVLLSCHQQHVHAQTGSTWGLHRREQSPVGKALHCLAQHTDARCASSRMGSL